jgi:hypothetical protein
VNFTREPIIETIITPKEGYKLIIRNSKVLGSEEHVVDALEIVSFGQSLFYRSMERPKPFILPVSDYEVVETKETRVVLKNASFERSIKIGGGKEASLKVSKEKAVAFQETSEMSDAAAVEQRLDKKREKKRHRRRRTSGQEEGKSTDFEPQPAEDQGAEGGGTDDETKVSSSPVSRLIPPPPHLISEKFLKEKTPQIAIDVEENVLPEPVVKEEEGPVSEEKKGRRGRKAPPQEESEAIPPADVEGGEVQRVGTEAVQEVTSTSFSTIKKNESTSFFGKFW